MPPPDLAKLFTDLKEKDPIQYVESALPQLKMHLTPEAERALIRTLAADYQKQLPNAIATEVIRLNNAPLTPAERKSFLDFSIKHGDKLIGASAVAVGAGWVSRLIPAWVGSPLGLAGIFFPFISEWYSERYQQKEKAQEQLLIMAIHNYYTAPSFKETVDKLPPNIFINDLDISPEKLVQRLPKVTKDLLFQVASIEHPDQLTQREIFENLLIPHFKTTANTIVKKKLQEKIPTDGKVQELYALRQEVDAGIKLTTLFIDKVAGKPEWASKFNAAAQSCYKIHESIDLFKVNRISSLVLAGNVTESLAVILGAMAGIPTQMDFIQKALDEIKMMMGEMWKDLSTQINALEEGQKLILTSLMQLDYKIDTLGTQLQDVSTKITHFQKYYAEQKRSQEQQNLVKTLKDNLDLSANGVLSQADFIKHLNTFLTHATSVSKQPVFAGSQYFDDEQPVLSSPLEYEVTTLFEIAKSLGIPIPASIINESGYNPIEWSRGVIAYLTALNSTPKNLFPNHVERDLNVLWENGLKITELLHTMSNKETIKSLTSHYRKAALRVIEDIKKIIPQQQGKEAMEKALLSLPSGKNFIRSAAALYKLTQINYLRQASSVEFFNSFPTLLGKELNGIFSIHALAAFVEENKQEEDIDQKLLEFIDRGIEDIVESTATLKPMQTIPIVEETMKVLGSYAAYQYPSLNLKRPEFAEIARNTKEAVDANTAVNNVIREMEHDSPSLLDFSDVSADYTSEMKPIPPPISNASSVENTLKTQRTSVQSGQSIIIRRYDSSGGVVREIAMPFRTEAQAFLSMLDEDSFGVAINRRSSVPAGSPKPSNAYVSTNCSVMIYDIDDYPNKGVLLEGHTLRVYQIHKLPNGNYITWSFDKSTCVWQKDGKLLHTFQNQQLWYEPVLLSGNRVATKSDVDNTISIFDYVSGRRTNHLVGHKGEVKNFVLSSDGKGISNSNDKTMRIWDLDIEYPTSKTVSSEPKNYEFLGIQALPGDHIFYYPRIRTADKKLITDHFFISNTEGALIKKVKLPATYYNLNATDMGEIIGLRQKKEKVTWRFSGGLKKSHLDALLLALMLNSTVVQIKWPSYDIDIDSKDRIEKILVRNRQIQDKRKKNALYNLCHFSAENDDTGTLAQLITTRKGNIYSCCSLGKNALHYAALKGHIGAARFLVQSGVSVCKVDGGGQTPLDVAVAYHSTNQALIAFLQQAQIREQWNQGFSLWPSLNPALSRTLLASPAPLAQPAATQVPSTFKCSVM